MIEIVLFILEIIGTVAFSVSGALIAIQVKFDIFGVIVVGCTTAVGGGITRDVIMGQNPPRIFYNLGMLGIAALTAIVVFMIAYAKRHSFEHIKETVDQINNYFDAAGLAAFTVMGTELGFSLYGTVDNVVLTLLLGVLTGVGGGLIRDIFINNTPYIFKKHIYAIASLMGAMSYYVIRLYSFSIIIPTVVGLVVVFALRVLATKYRWSLPKVDLDHEDE